MFSPISEIIADIAAGRPVVVTDDADRENEGDLVCAAEKVTPEIINFFAAAKGMICVPMTEDRARTLGLDPMVQQNREAMRTNFTVTVDAAAGITTGISAADRAHTIKLLADPESTPANFVHPGHINPLVARAGGVLRRAGHTEAAVDLARLAGLSEVGVICEILNEDGTMARADDLHTFCKENGLKMTSIEALIDYRRKKEQLVKRDQVIKLPTDFGEFDLYLYTSTISDEHHLALVCGEIHPDEPVLVRVHSECLTGDVFTSRRCDCGSQLHNAMERIQQEGSGVLLYMRQEGRGIGLPAKIHAYKLQEQGYDTVEANEKLGYGMDLRDYGMGAQILHDLGVRDIRLMTNNPKKVVGLQGHNLQIIEQVPIKIEANADNAKYLDTKRDKMDHIL